MKDEEQDSTEYKRPDAAKAFDIYDKQIAPKLTHLNTLKGDLSQPYDDIKKFANFPRKVLNFIIALENEEDDSKRDHQLLALAEGLRHRQLFLPRDLVTMADGDDGREIVSAADREDEDLLIDEGEDGDEAPSGTGAAAIAAMKKSGGVAGGTAATVN